MKKFGLICLALILSLGAIGVGYSMWSDEIKIEGNVTTGSVCLGIQPIFYEEDTYCANDTDLNWGTWVWTGGTQEGCPPGYNFRGQSCSTKDIAYLTFTPLTAEGEVIQNPVMFEEPIIEKLRVTIHNAYPHYMGCFTFHIYSCGTIPIHVQPAIIEQSEFLLIEYYNGVHQMHYGDIHEISLCVGVVQHKGYWGDPKDPSTWIVDDPDAELLPMDAGGDNPLYPEPLSFTISITGEQWNESP
jgi:hypothetical protein